MIITQSMHMKVCLTENKISMLWTSKRSYFSRTLIFPLSCVAWANAVRMMIVRTNTHKHRIWSIPPQGEGLLEHSVEVSSENNNHHQIHLQLSFKNGLETVHKTPFLLSSSCIPDSYPAEHHEDNFLPGYCIAPLCMQLAELQYMHHSALLY